MIPEWSDVRRVAHAKLVAAQNELQNCPLEHVERVRGRIEAYRTILALDTAPGAPSAGTFITGPG